MTRDYLGDSYDAVKRMWQEVLEDWAPLYANPEFIPSELRQDFTKLTRIQMLPDQPPRTLYSILNDPDTGIRLPSGPNQREGPTHITLKTIIQQLQDGATCVVTFDQSYHRNTKLIKLDFKEQLQAKMREVATAGLYRFYYVSHARFLFAFPEAEAFRKACGILTAAGIPETRIHKCK